LVVLSISEEECGEGRGDPKNRGTRSPRMKIARGEKGQEREQTFQEKGVRQKKKRR